MTPSSTIALALAIALAAGPASAQLPTPEIPLVVTADWLAPRRADPSVVVLHVAQGDDYEKGHVPGARKLAYSSIVTRRGTLGSELPDAAHLRDVFESHGVSDGTTVVVYAHEAPMATRVLFSLASIGHTEFALLDGGLRAWRAGKHATEKSAPLVTRGTLTERAAPEIVATAEWITPRLDGPGLAFIDTRTTGEYNGTGNRSGMPSAGHLAGARQLEWEQMFSDGMTLLKPRAELERMFGERVAAGHTVVTYCWVGYRASATWFVAKYLGYDARMYDGSYQDWSQRGLPAKSGTAP